MATLQSVSVQARRKTRRKIQDCYSQTERISIQRFNTFKNVRNHKLLAGGTKMVIQLVAPPIFSAARCARLPVTMVAVGSVRCVVRTRSVARVITLQFHAAAVACQARFPGVCLGGAHLVARQLRGFGVLNTGRVGIAPVVCRVDIRQAGRL